MMKRISKGSTLLILLLAAGCSTTKPAPTPAECVPVESPTCPVCAEPEPQVQHCPEPQVIEKIVKVPTPAPVPAQAATAGKLNLPIVGAVEWAKVEPGDIRLQARIDTGTANSAIHAEDIELIEKDGKRWVHFSLLDPATEEKVEVELRLQRTRTIKHKSRDDDKLYVVKMWISLGEARSQVDITLMDRDRMEYPLLIGRNMLVDTVIVDVSRKGVASK